jgi:NAD(P)-dependent dehydrogenase (short-subunit alcohol dehydrogenase family)
MARFKDKAIVVTGGAGGIGLATVRAFLAEGARVALLDKIPADRVPIGALPLVLDLAKEDEVRGGVDQVVRAFGKIDVLFNNCGVGANVDATFGRQIVMRGTLQANEDDLDFVIDNNLKTAIWVTKHVAPHMPRSESSCIVTSSSVWSRGRHVGAIAYTASKAALSSLTLNWAYEFAPVRSVALVLGAIDTPMCRLNPLSVDEVQSRTLAGRMGRPVEVADAVLFAAGCGFLNATEIVLDGGTISSPGTDGGRSN